MKAAARHRYGSYDAIEIIDAPHPACAPDEVLVDVRAAATNPLDWHMLTGTPLILRPSEGLRRPKRPVLGADFAGVVIEVGREVSSDDDGISVGDEVFGEGHGAFAEVMAVKPRHLAVKPASLSFEEAAAVPVAGLTALQALRDKAEVTPGQRVLVVGASGGVGTFGVQIARAMGAEVTGVCSGRNVELVESLGAGRVVDYTTTPIDGWGGPYDVVFDTVGKYPLGKIRRLLTRRGTLVLCGGPKDGLLWGQMSPLIRMLVTNPFVSQRMVTLLANANRADLEVLASYVESGEVRPVIDQRFELAQTADALRDLGRWRTRGKSVIII